MEYKKEGYLKIHVAVNIKTKKILAMEVTDDERVHDSKALLELVNGILKSNKMVDKLFADDGAYDNNDIFNFLTDNKGILPSIKLRKKCLIQIEERKHH